MRRWLLSCAAFLCLCGVALLATGTMAKSAGAKPQSKPAIQVKNTAEFFSWFFAKKGKIPPRNEFETDEQYRKRVPYLDVSKTLYFAIDGIKVKNYSYDLSTESMNVSEDGNGIAMFSDPPTNAVQILNRSVHVGEYMGTNAFGASAVVSEDQNLDYYLDISNIEDCPSGVYTSIQRDGYSAECFSITVRMSPDKAKRSAKNLRIVLGVRLQGFDRANKSSERSPPEMPNAIDLTTKVFIISAKLREVILWDSGTGEILCRSAVPSASSAKSNTSAVRSTSSAKLSAPAGRKVVIETTKGKIVAVLYENDAPISTRNFIDLVQRKFYNGLIFHRVEPGFVIQTGDPTGAGRGGSGKTIPLEISPLLKHDKGALGMARTTDPNSATSQFYITLNAIPNLDGSYAVFGQVIEGIDVAEKIQVGDQVTMVYMLETPKPKAKTGK